MFINRQKLKNNEFIPTHRSNNLSYSYGKGNPILLIGSILILLFLYWFFNFWYRLNFNSLVIGYFLFHDMRYATIFYATIMRLILYPVGLLNKKFKNGTEIAEDEFHQKINKVNNDIIKRKNKIYYLNKYKWVVLFNWFYLCLFTLNAITVGRTFWGTGENNNFNKEYIKEITYFKGMEEKISTPIKVSGYLPIVGEISLNEYSSKLNLLSAIGAGLVGLVQIIIEKKTSRKQVFMYAIMFPLGAYFLTDRWVPSGFEFALLIFEILTILIMFVEWIFEITMKKQKLKIKLLEEINQATKIGQENNTNQKEKK